MCGIAGSFGPNILSPDRVARTLGLMARRGPDGEGHYTHQASNHAISLLHTRLSIIDLDRRSNQPYVTDNAVLVFNGEIYNFPELKVELKSKGHQFKTAGDTEVIIAAYQQWGSDCVKHFEGMWAFALYDLKKQILLLSRDRFGEKPLYYWYRNGTLFFGSEVKFLAGMCGVKPNINIRQLNRFLANGYKSLYFKPDGFFEEIYELPAGTNAVFKAPSRPKPVKYWSLDYRPQAISLDEALEGAKERVFKAIELRLRADVPVALRLSGGIDSNVALGVGIGHFGRAITTFSAVEEDPRYDETAAILQSIKRFDCPHELIEIPKTGFMDRMSELIDYFGSPMMTISYYLHALVSQRINEKGFKVSLGGTGADEIFTGYYDHYLFWLAEMKGQANFADLVQGWRNSYAKFVRNPFLQDPEVFIKTPEAREHIFLRNDEFSTYLCDDFFEPHQEKHYCDAILRNRMLNELLDESVPVMLHEDDLCAMAYSVENRATYLDRQLVEFLFSVPSEHLVHNALPKYLLREAGRGLAEDEILSNPRKQGINAPVTSFVDFTDPDVRDGLLSSGPLYDIMKRDKVEGLLSSDITLNSQSKFLFSIVSAKLFLDNQLEFQP